jgi:hypothetical protein
MADTPLELYEEAYRLHYHDKKISEAARIYETIIRDFPDSNECGYAFIQLQKVKANDISKMLKKGPASLYPMIIIAFVTSLIALTIGIIGTVFMFQQLRQEHHRSTIAMMALGKMYSGSNEFAYKLIDELKSKSPLDPLASSFSSDLFAQKRAAALAAKQLAAQAAKPPAPDIGDAPKPALTKPPAARTKATTPVRRTTKPARNPIIYGTDSISYF